MIDPVRRFDELQSPDELESALIRRTIPSTLLVLCLMPSLAWADIPPAEPAGWCGFSVPLTLAPILFGFALMAFRRPR